MACAYVSSAPVPDVLREQLEYLMQHDPHCVTYPCVDCERIRAVEKVLMAPFAPHVTEMIGTKAREKFLERFLKNG